MINDRKVPQFSFLMLLINGFIYFKTGHEIMYYDNVKILKKLELTFA